MQISHTVPVLQEVLEVCSYCLLHAPYLLLLVEGRKSENTADPSASTATVNSKHLSAAACPSPCPPTTGTVLLRGKGKTVLQKVMQTVRMNRRNLQEVSLNRRSGGT